MARGGKRTGAGRKPNNPPFKSRHIRITDEQARLLRTWGKGDLSAGLRWLINESSKLIRRADKE